MHGDDRRIMEYQIENVSDAEDFTEACLTIPGFTAIFESLWTGNIEWVGSIYSEIAVEKVSSFDLVTIDSATHS